MRLKTGFWAIMLPLLIGLTTPVPLHAHDLTDPDQYRSSLQVYKPLFSFEEIAMRSLGPRRNNFTDQQLDRLTSVYGDFVLAVVFDQLNNYEGMRGIQAITLENFETKKQNKNNYGRLRFNLKLEGEEIEQTIVLEIRFIEAIKWKIYDIQIDQFTLVSHYRSQFAAFLENNSPEQLITHIQEKTKTLYGRQDQ